MQDLLSQTDDLLHEFCSEVSCAECIKVLEVGFVDDWTNHGEAVSLGEELSQVLLDFIFGNCFAVIASWQVFKSSLKVL